MDKVSYIIDLLEFAKGSIKFMGPIKLSTKLDSDIKDEIFRNINIILNEYLDCISDEFISEEELDVMNYTIKRSTQDTKRITSSRDFLKVAIYIGMVVDSWVEKGIELEEFESVGNLKHLLKY